MADFPVRDWLAEDEVGNLLHSTLRDDAKIRAVLTKARELKGLDIAEVAVLCQIGSADLAEELFETARAVKEQIYGHRMVLFAPLYISNVCGNDCASGTCSRNCVPFS